MMTMNEIIQKLSVDPGRTIKLMEVCGTHTSSIFKHGIRSLISPQIQLISGPGCPVCVTPAAYIDLAIELSRKEHHIVYTFGDMMKVRGTEESFSEARGDGARIEMMYSPFEVLELAKNQPQTQFIIAAVGFETTAAIYAELLRVIDEDQVTNIKLLTGIKTIIPALEMICESSNRVDGFISPGHVSVIIGSDAYTPLSTAYHKPFVIAGFKAEEILVAIYDLVHQIETEKSGVHNLYQSTVRPEGNTIAQALLEKYFEPADAAWRGLGIIPGSALVIKEQYSQFNAGTIEPKEDANDSACACSSVILGEITPFDCPLFGSVCTPFQAVGPCMVSSEGACGIYYRNRNLKTR